MKPQAILLIIGVVMVLMVRQTWAQGKPKPPTQPASGPGGTDCKHNQVVAKMYGTGVQKYWLFEPADPQPADAPLIVFNHGWSAMEPLSYGTWIDHIVKRGNIVVYPVYQDSLATPPDDFTPNAAAAISAAIKLLQTEPGHVRPELDKVAFVGHSMGGVISANLAALWQTLNVPQPQAVMCVEPGKTWAIPAATAVKLADLSLIPSNTLLLAVAGDRDLLAQQIDAKRIYHESTGVLPANKNFILLVSDEHGQPPLLANHFAPLAINTNYTDSTVNQSSFRQRIKERMEERHGTNSATQATGNFPKQMLDALDFFGTWKLFDGLTDAAFYGRNREYALGNTPQQRFMGHWSDGVPVNELIVTEQK